MSKIVVISTIPTITHTYNEIKIEQYNLSIMFQAKCKLLYNQIENAFFDHYRKLQQIQSKTCR